MKLFAAHRPMKLSLLTLGRDNLFALAKTLFLSLPPALYQEPQHPLVITLRGGFDTGKSIFFDAICDQIHSCAPMTLIEQAVFKDKNLSHRLDQRYLTHYQGHPFELSFINTAYVNRFSYSSPRIHETSYKNDGRGITFIDLHRHGGIVFIQNDDDSVIESSIDLWIEKDNGTIESSREESRLKKHLKNPYYSDLQDSFNKEHGSLSWQRYIEMSIFDHRLYNNPSFMEKIQQIKEIHSLQATKQQHPQAKKPRKLTPSQIKKQEEFLNLLF